MLPLSTNRELAVGSPSAPLYFVLNGRERSNTSHRHILPLDESLQHGKVEYLCMYRIIIILSSILWAGGVVAVSAVFLVNTVLSCR